MDLITGVVVIRTRGVYPDETGTESKSGRTESITSLVAAAEVAAEAVIVCGGGPGHDQDLVYGRAGRELHHLDDIVRMNQSTEAVDEVRGGQGRARKRRGRVCLEAGVLCEEGVVPKAGRW